MSTARLACVLTLPLGLACAAPSADTEETTTGAGSCEKAPCVSSLLVTLDHALPLLDGPHQITMITPLFDLECSIPAEFTGKKSCFGFRFADLEWDETRVTITLTEPFYDFELNPASEPFESVRIVATRGTAALADFSLPIDPGDELNPEPCGPSCWHAAGGGSI